MVWKFHYPLQQCVPDPYYPTFLSTHSRPSTICIKSMHPSTCLKGKCLRPFTLGLVVLYISSISLVQSNKHPVWVIILHGWNSLGKSSNPLYCSHILPEQTCLQSSSWGLPAALCSSSVTFLLLSTMLQLIEKRPSIIIFPEFSARMESWRACFRVVNLTIQWDLGTLYQISTPSMLKGE